MPDRFSLKTPTKWLKPNRNKGLNFKEPLKHCIFLDITIGTPGSNLSGYRCVSDCRSRGCDFDPAQSHTLVEIDHEIISLVILLPSAESFKEGCCQLQVCA